MIIINRPIITEKSMKLAQNNFYTFEVGKDATKLQIAKKVAEKFGKKRDENLFVILDRREGIKKALSLAKANDVVMFTGKGAEQSMIIGGKSIPWDDRRVVEEEIKKVLSR